MKPEINKEMDLLLRRLGRSASDLPKDGDHLDVDELSSYAENALPAGARARYTEHLGECSSCRKLVAQLSSSVRVVTVAETAKVSEPSALRKFLASLFSTTVLRFAVPALGLIVVAVIGLTVSRQPATDSPVARVNDQDQNKAGDKAPNKALATQSEPVQSPATGFDDKQEKGGSPPATAETRGERSKETQPAPPPNAPPSVSVAAEVNQAARPAKGQQQPVANEAAAAKPEATDETQKRSDTEAAKQEVRRGAVSNLARERAAAPPKGEDRRTDDFTVARPAAGADSVSKIQRDGLEEKDKKDTQTRSVAGRRFRRASGVWIDTAYDSSRSTISLSRGSEYYRGLVADEPAIRTIAEQLEGEIIVVWKGRSYRIR